MVGGLGPAAPEAGVPMWLDGFGCGIGVAPAVTLGFAFRSAVPVAGGASLADGSGSGIDAGAGGWVERFGATGDVSAQWTTGPAAEEVFGALAEADCRRATSSSTHFMRIALCSSDRGWSSCSRLWPHRRASKGSSTRERSGSIGTSGSSPSES